MNSNPDIYEGIWTHRKHNPAEGRYRQYRILYLTLPAQSDRRHGSLLPLVQGSSCTDTLTRWYVCHNAQGDRYLYSPRNGGRWSTSPMVIYTSIHPGKHPGNPQNWLRPYTEFFDGRFKLEPLTNSHEPPPILTTFHESRQDSHQLSR